MSLKRYMTLLLVLVLILCVLPMTAAAAARAEESGETVPVEEPVEEQEGIPWAITAAFLAMIVTFLQNKFIHGRR